MARNTRREFTVEGSGTFPIDMLRYDACWPKSEGLDSYAIQNDYGERPRRRIVLVTDNVHAPTVGRWESFTWKVVGLGDCRDESEVMGAVRRASCP